MDGDGMKEEDPIERKSPIFSFSPHTDRWGSLYGFFLAQLASL